MNVKLPHLYAQTLLPELQVCRDWVRGWGRSSGEAGARKQIRRWKCKAALKQSCCANKQGLPHWPLCSTLIAELANSSKHRHSKPCKIKLQYSFGGVGTGSTQQMKDTGIKKSAAVYTQNCVHGTANFKDPVV